MSEKLLEVKNLVKYFPTPGGMLHAVDHVNFSIGKGETLGVVGESGCGKSTLGRVILRLLEADEGEIFFEGENIREYNKKELKHLRTQMQIVFQDPYSSINPRKKISDIIAEPMIVNHIIPKDQINKRVKELMELSGLAERYFDAYPHELDGGRRQRVGIARALGLNPKFIVCDEPVSALDVSIQAQILNLLMDLQRDLKLTYMFITHDLSVVKHISTDVAVLYLGQCVEKAPSDELFSNPMHPYTKALLSAIPVPDLDIMRNKKQVIRGEVTSPINLKPGCRFAGRCEYATEKCFSKNVELRENSDGHFVACRLYERGV